MSPQTVPLRLSRCCPFCGGDRELKLIIEMPQAGVLYTTQVMCGHCAARGGCFSEETLEEAAELAISNWEEPLGLQVTQSKRKERK